MVITITMNIQEATPAEIKGVLEQFAVFNDTKVEVKQPSGSAAEKPKPKHHRWTLNEDIYVKLWHEKGLLIPAIVEELYKKFGFRVSQKAVEHRIKIMCSK